jgi:ABC-type multidrug transport system ATPase subunit
LVLVSDLLCLASLGKTVIYSSHILDVVEKICNRVLIIHNGNLLADGTVERSGQRRTTQPSSVSKGTRRALRREGKNHREFQTMTWPVLPQKNFPKTLAARSRLLRIDRSVSAVARLFRTLNKRDWQHLGLMPVASLLSQFGTSFWGLFCPPVLGLPR